MPIKSIFWNSNSGRDIHVLRGGVSRDLIHESLVFEHTDDTTHFADDYLVQFADVTLTFTPLFKGVLQPNHIEFVGDHNGITVFIGTGAVSVDALFPLNVKSNFIMEVEAKNDGDGHTFHETIRVQVHGSVTQLWLTPDQLTLRPPLVRWVPRSMYTVGESLVDANHCLQAVTAITGQITNVSILDNVLTLAVNQNFARGGSVTLSNLTTAAFLNGQTLIIKSAEPTQITADFTHADFSSTDTGTAVSDEGRGLSGNGPAPPAFSDHAGTTVTDNQLIWRNRNRPEEEEEEEEEEEGGWVLETNYRFSLRAQFDDGVVGDLTENYEVVWSDATGHVLSDGRITVLSGDSPGDKFPVTATLPLPLGGMSTPLGPSVEIGRSWADEPSPPKLTIVAGGGLPAASAAEDAPNILMLGDGFRIEDQDSFGGIIDTIVTHMKTNQLTKPYNLLSSRMNFWKAFAPVAQTGISVRSEVYALNPISKSFARPIPVVEKPPAPGKPWALEHVLYAVGLPVPGDDHVARTPAILKAEWQQLLQTDPTPNISDNLVLRWKRLANRAFIEEQDGFPALSYGVPPAANQTDTNLLDLHEYRATADGLRPFYRVLTNGDVQLADGRPVGVLWAENMFRFDNTDLVLIISSFPGGRAANYPGYIPLNTGGDNARIPIKPVAGKNAFTMNLTAIPTDVEADRSRTVAHELGHSFGLGDEYADFDRVFPEDHADASDANLQTEKDTQIPDPADPTKRIISGDQIPWIWHRIVASTVVNGDISAEGLDTFVIPVEPDVSFRFVKDDQLLLRPRIRGKPLRKFNPLDISGVLIVLEDPKRDSIRVRATTAPISAERFPAGSLLFKPKPAPASVLSLAYPYAEMTAKNIKDLITANRKPLTVVPCVLALPDPDPNPAQQPILKTTGPPDVRTTAVANLRPSLAGETRIVGLYAGGASYSCGIFHPTGQCMMRNSDEAHAEFCAVCRYIIVDMIAPEFHSEIDADYDKIYPLI